MAILAFTAGLTHKFTFNIAHCFAQCFAIGHLWTANIRLNAKLAFHTINDNVQMQLTHAGNDRLAGLLVRVQPERRIFCRQTLQRDAHFFLIRLGFWLDRE
ncbi:hypothetical protein D3C72_2042800 [compost metagenome]